MNFKKIIKLILVITWMGVIFIFSQDNGNASNKKSDSLIIKVYQIFDKRELSSKEKEKIIEKLVFPVRKLAHFSEYMIINMKSILIAISITMLYAVSDEIHQLFSAGRSCRILDVIIDTLGGSTGIIIYNFIRNKLSRRSV